MMLARCVWLLIAALLPLTAAFGQTAATDVNEVASAPVTMRAGSIDVAVSGGLGGLVYPFVEPQIAVGIVPIGPDLDFEAPHDRDRLPGDPPAALRMA